MSVVYARREVLRDLDPRPGATHPGLWLDRFLKEQEVAGNRGEGGENGNPRAEHIRQVASLGEPSGYREAFERWEASLGDLQRQLAADAPANDSDAWTLVIRKAKVDGRMAVGLGAESTVETSIALQRSWGTPVVPGSALKGLAAACAHKLLHDERWRKPVEGPDEDARTSFLTMFGDVKAAGFVTFYDAWYVPGSAAPQRMLEPDVLTIHHPLYYRGEGPPADSDSPTPVSFLTAQGQYLIALAGPRSWLDAAIRILALGLEHLGIGAKTSSGYGRLTLEGVTPILSEVEMRKRQEEVQARAAEEQRKRLEAERRQATTETAALKGKFAILEAKIAGTGKAKLPERIHELMQELRVLTPDYQLVLAPKLLEKVRAAFRPEKLEQKSWYAELVGLASTSARG